MKIVFSLVLSFYFFTAFGQYDIDIKLTNFDGDTIIIGNYFADKQLVKDTLISKKKGKFEFEGKDTLPQGVYFIMPLPKSDFIQFFISDDTEFDIEWNVKDVSDVKMKGTEDNALFIDYIKYLGEKRPQADVWKKEMSDLDSLGKNTDHIQKKLDELDMEVKERQQKLLLANPNYLSTKFIKSGQQIDIPEFEGDESDIQLKKYLFYKKHYFDNIDIGDPAMLRTPYLHDRIEYYREKLTPQDPDSIIISIDYLLSKMKPSKETYRYYLSYFLNQYAKSKNVGFDKIYVHLVDQYYAKGIADWVDEENLKKLIDQANDLRPGLIGKKFPDITTYKKDGTPVRLWDVESPYTVVLFWAHDCGHCTKSMPDIVDFYEEYQSKGVTLISICTKAGEKTKPCMEAVPSKGMDKFINTFDEYQRYRNLIKIVQTPKIFILDKDKNIIIKDLPSKEMKSVMEQIIRRDAGSMEK